jgi:tRNA dimethylallyltransferase
LDRVSLDLLDTFWMERPMWPGGGDERDSENRAGPSKGTVEDDKRLLSLWTVLKGVDAMEAGRWHWRDGRKVRRALERWWERGGPVSSTRLSDTGDHSVASKGGRKARYVVSRLAQG